MNFISIMAVTFEVAKEQAVTKTGYAPDTIGPVVLTVDQGNNSRQQAYVFETSNDVTRHPQFVPTNLSDNYDVTALNSEDGPVLVFGAEVTVGG